MPKAKLTLKPPVATTSELLMSYYKTKLQLDLLTTELAEKKELVLGFLKTQPEMKYSTSFGSREIGFSVRTTPIYEYSGDVVEMEEKAKLIAEKVKEVKKQEVATGKAKVVNNQYAVYVR